MIQLVTFSCIAIVLVAAEMKFHPTTTDDLQSIIQSVKKDVDRHMKLMSERLNVNSDSTPNEKSTVSSESSTNEISIHEKTSVYDNSKDTSEYLSDGSDVYYDSKKGRPGIDFPDYTDIPRTSFTCSDKTKTPGFYADMETGCQVFHVCWPDRRESFLCPMGTIFNQAISACDYWYSSDCSLANSYYSMHSEILSETSISESVDINAHKTVHKAVDLDTNNPVTSVMFFVSEFMPVKAKVVVYPKTETQRQKIVVSASTGQTGKESKSRKRKRLSKSRVPRSLEYLSSSTEPIDKLENKMYIYHSWEALNDAVLEIQNNETTAHLAPYAERISKFIKKWFLGDKDPVPVDVEPGTKLADLDNEAKETAQEVQIIFRKLMELVSINWHDLDMRRKEKEELNYENSQDELETLNDEPFANLNPKFIVKPTATKINFKEQEESSTEKSRLRRATATFNPLKLSHEGSIKIYPETKAALLKNYMNLYNRRHA